MMELEVRVTDLMNPEGGDDMTDPVTEKKRLEATALVASKVSREEASIRIKHEKIRTYFREAVLLVLVVVVALLGYRNLTEGGRTKAAVIHAAQVNCQQYHDVAIIPLVANTSVVGLSLIADFRNSYYGFDCEQHTGQLPIPDPRLLPYLNKDAKGGTKLPSVPVPVPASSR